MKKCKAILVFFLAMTVFVSCESEEEQPLTIQDKVELLEENQWLLKDFEDAVMYTFSNGERYTHYAVDGAFTEDAIPGTEEYTITGDLLTMDFHFGNVNTYEVVFSCNNSIVDFYTDGVLQQTLYERDSDYLSCI